jgi:putative aldouronate transport system substrate-binding protein
MEDYDKAIRAFAARDPDGNGRKDTYGIYATNVAVFDQLRMFAIGYGGVHTWKIDANGAFINEVQTPEYRKALDLFRDYYNQGILNPDFVALSATQDIFDAFQAQKTGFMLMEPLDDALKQGAVLTLDSKADIAVTAYLTDTNGKNYIPGGTGHSGGFLFGKKAIKDEETLVKVLKVFDKIAEPEGRITNACVWGLEGRHFTIENGKLKQTAEQKELNNLEVMNFVQYRVTFDHRASWDNADVSQLQFDVIDAWNVNESMAVMDPSLPFISNTYVEKGTQLDNERKDAVIKYIMGELDGRGYDAAIQKWLNDGGAAMAKEFAAAYKASQP